MTIPQASISRRLPLVFFALYFLFVLYGLSGKHWRGLDNGDEELYHLPAVASFAGNGVMETLPDYTSATAPLWHIVLSKVYRLSGDSLLWTRLANSAAGLALVFFFYRGLKAEAALRLLLALSFALSIYVYGPSVRLSTDDVALLGLLALLLLTERDLTTGRLLAASAILTLTCLVRQNYAWLWGLLGVWTLRQTAGGVRLGKAAWTATFVLAALSACSLLLLFRLWGGLNPPGFRFHAPDGIRLCYVGCLYLLACFGFFGCFLKPTWPLRPSLRQGALELGAALLAVALLHLLHAGCGGLHRAAGILWFLGEKGPKMAGVPIFLGILAVLGAWFLFACALDTKRWIRWRFLLLVGGVFAMAALNLAAYQKYYEPVAIVLLALGGLRNGENQRGRGAYLAAALLLVFQLVVLHSKLVF